ncbi:MAG: hypothetical protein NTY77_03085, partial [Elusimicrobia bacterium]|nr:hypothetical protein [Elusimicrobiota bacterium]
MKKSPFLLLALLAGAWCAAPARGATFRPQGTAAPGSVPGGINYQGQLQQNGVPVTAKWDIVFRIYNCGPDPAVSASCPTETQIGADMPASVDIVSGLFSVNIPVTTNTLVGGGQRWLEMEIFKGGLGAGGGIKMKPREQLYSMPYALVAKTIEGTIDISTGGFVINAPAASSNAAFYVSSGTAFIGIGTSHPSTLFNVSGGTLTIDGAGAGLHLDSGLMLIDGTGASLVVQASATFGNANSTSGFTADGALQLNAPLDLKYGGTGQNFHDAAKGSILYFDGSPVVKISSVSIGGPGSLLTSNGSIPAWSTASYPSLVYRGDLLYGSADNVVSTMSVGVPGSLLQSSWTVSGGTVPAWTSASYPGVVFKGDLLYGSAANIVSTMTIGGAGSLLRSDGKVPAWTSAKYPDAVYKGDLLYGSLDTIVSTLSFVNTPTRYLANTGGAGTIPAWDQVDLANGVKNTLSVSSGGTGADLSGASQGFIPYFNNNHMMVALSTATAGWFLTTAGAGANPFWKNLADGTTIYRAINLVGGKQGSLPYQSAMDTTMMLDSGTAAGQLLTMAVNPAWTMATYPGSTSKNQILYSITDDTVTGLGSISDGILVTDISSVPSIGRNIPADVTIGGSYIYRVGGTTVPFADGGTNTNLFDGVAIGSLIYKKDATSLGGAALTGVIKGNGASAPTVITSTPGYVAYWSDASTIAGVPYIAISSGGTNADLSGPGGIGGLIYKVDASTLANTGTLTGVLRGNGSNPPTPMTGAPGQIVYWLTASTIAATPSVSISSGGTGADNSAAATGALFYMAGSSIVATSALTGVLKGNGSNTPSTMSGSQGQIAYWLDANTIGGVSVISISSGGTGADLSGPGGIGGLIYKKDATSLAGTGALTGVLRADSNGPTANTGTAGYITYWVTNSTIAATRYVSISSGGTGADLSNADIGGLIYKKDATSLAGLTAPTGILRSDSNGPTANTGTANYIAYWVTNSTIAATRYVSISSGGLNADNSVAATGALFYMAGSSIVATSALTGVLKGNNTGAPSAMTGTPNYLAYWADANTLAATPTTKVSLLNGGTNADNSGAGQGGVFYMAASSLVASSPLTGVLKGNNTSAPSAMTGTANQIAYWSDANTLAATPYVSLSSGGMNTTNAGAAPGALFYMAGSSVVATSALTGVLKGNGAGAPSAMTGTANYLAYWSDANTLAATPYVSLSSGGLNATN